ncbi:MAG TPA: LapA family protein [Solirubrobacteraceae bacterium]|nr:LapA family protein [Solirubrobacteraceae bacterium]
MSDTAPEKPHETSATPTAAPKQHVERTRLGATYKGLLVGVVVLVLLLVFVLENTQRVKINYFGASGHVPLGVAFLVAAVAGAILVAVIGTARIMQLRRRIRRLAQPPSAHPPRRGRRHRST